MSSFYFPDKNSKRHLDFNVLTYLIFTIAKKARVMIRIGSLMVSRVILFKLSVIIQLEIQARLQLRRASTSSSLVEVTVCALIGVS